MKLFLLVAAASLSSSSSFLVRTSPPLASTTLEAGGGEADSAARAGATPAVRDAPTPDASRTPGGDVDGAATPEALVEVVEDLLETALDYIRTKERVEEGRAAAAHWAFEDAKREGTVLREHVVEDSLDIPADFYAEERLYNARATEKRAVIEELEHLNKWAELRVEEEAIKQTLRDLKGLKP